MLDFDLARLYGVETKVFNQAVKRNIGRFPDRFRFQLTAEEYEDLRSQFVTSKRGGRRYLPYAFTESGVAMLSAVLRSETALKVSIGIMDAFIIIDNTSVYHIGASLKDAGKKTFGMALLSDESLKTALLNKLQDEFKTLK